MLRDYFLEELRNVSRDLPGAEETVKWGYDIVFQVNGKMFAIIGEWRGDLCLTVKVGKQAMGVFLEDSRYFEAPYVGKHGWVSLKLYSAPAAEEVSELVRGSYELVRDSKRRSRPGQARR